jgi:hypothetical protein
MSTWNRDRDGDRDFKPTTDPKADSGSVDSEIPREHNGITVTTVLSQESIIRSEDTASTKRLVTEVL